MLTIHDFANATFKPWPGEAQLPAGATWIDANAPTAEESAFLLRALGVEPPNLAKMSEIETSSRFYRMPDAICVTIPLPKRDAAGVGTHHPLALILTPKALLTVRYEELRPCQPEYLDAIGVDRGLADPTGAMIAVLEAIVDHLADELELATARLDEYSHKIFAAAGAKRRSGLNGRMLQSLIGVIGRKREYTSLMEETVLTLSRMTPFLEAEIGAQLPPEAHKRLDRIASDVGSLASHESRLSDKIQFLLDASLGLINVEQNDIFKVLTIVSVIGIPPTLIASMYGMNFKTIPEYDWAYGYPYGLTLIFLSAALPLLWFKWRRWW
jgi:magnesium transporter